MTYLNQLEKMRVLVSLTDLALTKEDERTALTIKGKVYAKK